MRLPFDGETPSVIDNFDGKYRFLSNFSEDGFSAPHSYVYGDPTPRWWPTNEHYFQAMKTIIPDEITGILEAPTPAIAKRLGRRANLCSEWDRIKFSVMRTGLKYKFAAGSELAQRLLETGDAMLIEGNTWGDTFWGVCRGQGQNWLGHLLMARRAELRAYEV